MALTPLPLDNFALGLNLRDQPALPNPAYALDCSDVVFDGVSVAERPGYTQFAAAVGSDDYVYISGFDGTFSPTQIIAATPTKIRAFSSAGALVTEHTPALPPAQGTYSSVVFGGPTGSAVYINAVDDGGTIIKYNAGAFTTVTTAPVNVDNSLHIEVTPWDNRLVTAQFGGTQIEGNNASTIRFSEPGDPENFQDNYVDLQPGDGEGITAMIGWREYLFVFKQSKFFVFYGTSSTASGDPEFNYRPIETGIGSSIRQVCATSDGVYFMHRTGLYRSTGGPPELVSDVLHPLFYHLQAPFSPLLPLDWSSSKVHRYGLRAWRNKIILHIPISGSATAGQTLVFDPQHNTWAPWTTNFSTFAPFVISDEELIFALPGDRKLYRMSPQYTDDNGVAIAADWQSGWFDGGSPDRKQIRQFKLWGEGTMAFKVATNYRTDYTTTDSLVFGSVPLAVKLSRKASRGTVFSVRFESAGPFRIGKAVAYIREVSMPTKIS